MAVICRREHFPFQKPQPYSLHFQSGHQAIDGQFLIRCSQVQDMEDQQAFQLVLMLTLAQRTLTASLPNAPESSPTIPRPNPCKQDRPTTFQCYIQLQPALLQST